MLRKFIISVICCMSILSVSLVCSYADTVIASDDHLKCFDNSSASSILSSNFDKSVRLSFDSLSDLCVQVNNDILSGVFGNSVKNYSATIASFTVGGSAYYGIALKYGSNTLWYCRYPYGLYYARIDTDTFIGYISDKLTTVVSNLGTISSTVSTISDTLSKWPSSLSTVSTISTNLYNFQTNVQKSLSDLYSAATGYFDSQVYSDLPTMFSRMGHDYYYGSADERTAISAAFDRYWLTSMSSGKSYVSPEVLNDICADLNKANIRCSVYYDADLGLSYIKGLGGPYIVDPSDWNPSGAAYEALSTSNRIFAVRELAVVSSNRNLSYYAAQASGRLLKTVDSVQYTVADLQYNTWQQTKSAVTKLGSIDTRLSTLHTDAASLGNKLDNIADLLNTTTFTCGYKSDSSGTAYPTQTIPYNMAVQIAARINSELLGKQMTVILRNGSGTSPVTISRCQIDSNGYIYVRSSSNIYYLCGKDNTIFVADQDYTKSIYSRLSDVISAVNNLTVGVDLSDVSLSVDASSINLFNNTAYCCGYLTDADGNKYPVLPIPYDAATAIVERLNTDYIDKKITVLQRSGTTFTGSVKHAYISSSGNINLRLTNGYGYALCDSANTIYQVDASTNYGSRANETLTGISSQLVSTQTNIESALSTIIDKMDNLPASVDNIVVNITKDNDAYNVFYVEDENGDKKSVTSVAGDSLSASGKLLQFLYKLIIGSAISDVDSSINGLNDFYFDNAPSGLGEGVTVWD